MVYSTSDHKLAAAAAGFTLGFGFLTTWQAIKQTRANKNPARSSYIYMLWGEIASNIGIGVIGWLMLDGDLDINVGNLFALLFFWAFETQLQPQIIINRCSIIAESRETVKWIKWSTIVFIALVQVSVFVIWIPSHITPARFVWVNSWWDRTTKILFLLVDAGLNWWFLRTVKQRLIKQHGLVKYKPLIAFNFWMMVIGILMDIMIVALLSLPNELVYIQFHPVCYMVKLNIEMSMATLITRLATSKADATPSSSHGLSYANNTKGPNTNNGSMFSSNHQQDIGLNYVGRPKGMNNTLDEISEEKKFPEDRKFGNGIVRSDEWEVRVSTVRDDSPPTTSSTLGKESGSRRYSVGTLGGRGGGRTIFLDDEESLTGNPGHP